MRTASRLRVAGESVRLPPPYYRAVHEEGKSMRRITMISAVVTTAAAIAPSAASAHVHGIAPLLTLANECGVTSLQNTGANRAQGGPITGLIPQDVGQSPLTVGDGGFTAPVGCAD
jgi:hypothetical protein